ncbi:MAG: hypothetical protein GY769_09620 [bacterium]|nr:hypothetical protein [bacterium]
MTESSEAGRVWATALAVVAVVALLAGVYFVHSLLSLPGRVVEAGREVADDLRDLAAAFHQGKVETAFVNHATELSGGNKLQVAELSQVEIYTRTESSSVLWGTLQLPDVVVEARVPVEYVYYLDLSDDWLFELEDNRLRVRAPRLEFNTPALDVSRLEYDVRAASILRDEDAAITALQSGLTQLSRERARRQIGLVRETARRQVEEFVASWLGAAFDSGEAYAIDVVFEGEPVPGEGATLRSVLEGDG